MHLEINVNTAVGCIGLATGHIFLKFATWILLYVAVEGEYTQHFQYPFPQLAGNCPHKFRIMMGSYILTDTFQLKIKNGGVFLDKNSHETYAAKCTQVRFTFLSASPRTRWDAYTQWRSQDFVRGVAVSNCTDSLPLSLPSPSLPFPPLPFLPFPLPPFPFLSLLFPPSP